MAQLKKIHKQITEKPKKNVLNTLASFVTPFDQLRSSLLRLITKRDLGIKIISH